MLMLWLALDHEIRSDEWSSITKQNVERTTGQDVCILCFWLTGHCWYFMHTHKHNIGIVLKNGTQNWQMRDHLLDKHKR